MKTKYKLFFGILLALLLAFLVVAENGMFDDTNYNEYDIKNVSSIYTNKTCFNDACTVYDYYNGSCVYRVGSTATLITC